MVKDMSLKFFGEFFDVTEIHDMVLIAAELNIMPVFDNMMKPCGSFQTALKPSRSLKILIVFLHLHILCLAEFLLWLDDVAVYGIGGGSCLCSVNFQT